MSELEEEKYINSDDTPICSKPFNLKPYLNLINCDSYEPDNKIKKIISFPKAVSNNSNDIILNFSQIAGKFLVFNILSNSVVGNYLINHYDYEEPIDNNNLQNIYNFINAFINKSWSLKQYEFASYIFDKICQNQQQNEFKKLAKVLSLSSDNNYEQDSALEQIKDNNEYEIDEEGAKNIYESTIVPVLSFTLGNITIYTIVQRIKEFLDKVYEGFIAHANNNFSLIKGKFRIYQILFMKCLTRNIDLKELFKFHDKNNKGYVDGQIAKEIFSNLPIGLDDSELNELLSVFNLFDENNKYLYNYLFDLDEYLIPKIESLSPSNKDNVNVFSCEIANISIFQNQASQHVINSIFCKRELTDIIYLSHANLIFTITPYNKNIYIFKRDTKLSNNPEVMTKIGSIFLNSYYNHTPIFLDF